MTLSLAAVFIPVLFMGGVIGRLFHEFAVTIGVAILVSGRRVADADADAVQPLPQAERERAARPLLPDASSAPGRSLGSGTSGPWPG